tara:strand:- start:204 stop:380 length:177 start_codon:yes stop_codon:yes gene_type:complete
MSIEETVKGIAFVGTIIGAPYYILQWASTKHIEAFYGRKKTGCRNRKEYVERRMDNGK